MPDVSLSRFSMRLRTLRISTASSLLKSFDSSALVICFATCPLLTGAELVPLWLLAADMLSPGVAAAAAAA